MAKETTGPTSLSTRHLLGIEDLTRGDIQCILQTATSFRDINDRPLKKVPVLRGRTIVNIFFENSTRTRLSFELAAKRLSADTVNFTASSSSLSKGETLLDTARNIEAMRPDLVVVRHSHAGAAHMLTQVVRGCVVNAGDGQHEHPTQALLDAYTILEKFNLTAEQGLNGKTVTIVGDIAHSRVARSNMFCLSRLGANVRVAGPATMLPPGLEQYGVQQTCHVDEALDGADVVMMLRIQKERFSDPVMSSDREYARRFGLTRERAKRLSSDTIIMHPGPINRGVEIAPEVADSKGSVILEQAENGVAVRMAVLYLLAVGDTQQGAEEQTGSA
jgi:aspartate carbamoyltransferase catalytic subunit